MSIDEDNYAARIGKMMWRVAKRRAEEVGLYAATPERSALSGVEASGAENTIPPPTPPRD